MHQIQYQLGFMKAMAFNLTLAGLLSVTVGVLILVYPAFLALLVSLLLIVVGLMLVALAVKINRMSKIRM